MLVNSRHWKNDVKEICSSILSHTIKEENKYQVGLTKLFFRAGMLAYLEQVRTDRINFLVTLMQKNFLRAYHHTRYKRLKASVIGVQSAWRCILAKREKERRRQARAVSIIQRQIRCYLARQKFLQTRAFVVQLQACE